MAIDLETTGLDPQTERIIEVGAIRFIDGEEAEKMTSFLYPRKELPEEIVRLTGITDDDLKDAPYAAEVLPELKDFIGRDPICAQNAPFDITFLRVEFARLGVPFLPNRSANEVAFDTAVLGRALLPDLESHSLFRLADYFNIDGGVAHRAEDDARRCGKLLLKLSEILPQLGISECATAGKILGIGVMADMFRGMAEHLSRLGAPMKPSRKMVFSKNILGTFNPEEKVDSVSKALEGVFGASGTLSARLPGYEPRPKQGEMAEDCAGALFEGNYLMAEAGTGTGKSFAYLVPAILFSISNKKRVVVSTNTKNLQEQLFSKDIPFLIEALPFKFQAALLKGRGNYLCRRKWLEVLADPDYLLAEDERTRALAILFWANRTSTGDIAENNGFQPGGLGGLWNKFASEAGACMGQKCSQFSECFLQKARDQASKSHLVVVNHALVLSDIAAENAVLEEYSHLIVDEAHNLEKAASKHLGLEANIFKLRAFCHKLYRKDGVETGFMARMRKKSARGKAEIGELVEQAIIDVNRIRANGGEFFARISEAIRLEYFHQKETQYTLKKRYSRGDSVINAGREYLESLLESLDALVKSLRRLAEALADTGEDISEEGAPGLEAASAADEAERLASDIIELTDADDPDWVHWWELPRREKAEVGLFSAPLCPGEILNARMYPWLESIIFTSATMTIADEFTYFHHRLGLDLIEDKKVVFKNYGSPFDFSRQAIFAVPAFLPGPKNAVEFTEALADLVIETAVKFRRGTLVLFTAYQQLNQVYNLIRGPLSKEGISLLGQGIDGSRSDLLRRFLSDRAVLLGTDSFWEGIDAPGEALEILMVAKLPFDVPTEPLVEARAEKLEREGRNSFLEYTIPEAAVKLRQGVGRLIRSTVDIGAVIICDKRMITSRWGAIFRDSLPGRVEVLGSLPETVGAISEIMNDEG